MSLNAIFLGTYNLFATIYFFRSLPGFIRSDKTINTVKTEYTKKHIISMSEGITITGGTSI